MPIKHKIILTTSVLFCIYGFWSIFLIVQNNKPWDFIVDYQTAVDYTEGLNPYSEEGFAKSKLHEVGPTGNGHPPCTSFWFLPYTIFSLKIAHFAHTLVCLILLYSVIKLALELSEFPCKWYVVVPIFSLMLNLPYIKYHMLVGQLSIIIAWLVLLTLKFSLVKKYSIAGLFWGIACTLKFFPGLLCLYFLITKKWKTLAIATIAFIVPSVVMSAKFGLLSWPYFLKKQEVILDLYLGNIMNHSIHGVILRFFQPSWLSLAKPNYAANFISLSTSMIFILLISYASLRHFRNKKPQQLPFATFILATCIFSQWAWSHYNIIYLFPALLNLKLSFNVKNRYFRYLSALPSLGVFISWLMDFQVAGTMQRSVLSGDATPLMKMLVLEGFSWIPLYLLFFSLMVKTWVLANNNSRENLG